MIRALLRSAPQVICRELVVLRPLQGRGVTGRKVARLLRSRVRRIRDWTHREQWATSPGLGKTGLEDVLLHMALNAENGISQLLGTQQLVPSDANSLS